MEWSGAPLEKSLLLGILCGALTSTPALGALIEAGGEVSLPAYSFAYLGALLTAVIGIGFL